MREGILIGIMRIRESISKHKQRFIIFAFVLAGSLAACLFAAKEEVTDLNNNIIEIAEEELTIILGEWKVNEYLGKSTEFHGVGEKTNEQKVKEEIMDSEIKEIYLGKSFVISYEKVEFFHSPTELGYYCLDWGELFNIYRQPPDIWDGWYPPFICISVKHEDFSDAFSFIVSENNNAVLYIKGLFFRVERGN